MAATKTLSIQDVADIIEKSPRTIRKALRAHFDKDAQPGRGGRWVIAEKDTEGSKFEQRTFKLFNDLFDRTRSAWDNSAKKPGGIPFGPSFDGNPFYK